ncbi:hypothetical protein CcaverHIS002_0502340 [Cutaneotrichosporon cavernicola]|nr:hypothetical protein CcaverHIS002_0502340 [Cutaneotrichosporon cavernicola]
MEASKDRGELETCPICPDSGPPVPQKSTTEDRNEDDEELQWIACSKCKKWYHCVCAALIPEFKDTIPAELRQELEASGLGEWFDWANRVDRWYCKPCIDFSRSPENPKPPRNPIQATLRRRRVKQGSTSASPSTKRSRLDSQASVTPSANGDVTPDRGRPKRRAALDRPDYYNMHNHNATPTRSWLDLIKNPAKHGRVIKEGELAGHVPAEATGNFPRVPGSLLRKQWIESGVTASDVAVGDLPYPTHLPPTLFYGPTREPLVVRPEDGGITSMGGKVPDPGLTVDDVSRLVGPHRMVDVIDVATQQSSQWPLEKWARYVKGRSDPNSSSSSKVYNIISLEISGTDLAQNVRAPSIVSDIDWVENFWPFPGGPEAAKRAAARAADGLDDEGQPKGKAKNEWPKVQLYCLMGMGDAWTDWHVDFAASSVYYSVHTGSKMFFFIRPTEANLAAYARWSGSHELQQSTWLPDMCDEVRKVTLVAGDTMIIPAGYIHAVFTPVDSIVFGGNFVHSYDIPTQLRMREIEIDTRVPQRFRLCWYVADRFTNDLRQLRAYRPTTKAPAVKRPYERILRGLIVLARFLIGEADKMTDEATEDKQRQSIYRRIPTDIQDPAALAHELLWRVENELPDLWEDDDEVKVVGEGKGKRAKRVASGVQKPELKAMRLLDKPAPSRTWKFQPSPWAQADHPITKTTTKVWLPRPGPGGDGAPEEATESSAVYHQSRKRTREEGGETILEDQDVLFTERRIIWPSKKGSVVAEGDRQAHGCTENMGEGIEVKTEVHQH